MSDKTTDKKYTNAELSQMVLQLTDRVNQMPVGGEQNGSAELDETVSTLSEIVSSMQKNTSISEKMIASEFASIQEKIAGLHNSNTDISESLAFLNRQRAAIENRFAPLENKSEQTDVSERVGNLETVLTQLTGQRF